ncbi:PREDICTED: zinc finger protein 704-like [Crocodylus porosus]|uniref:zinc finger protein 704-like n=1 Tax=Crocodylus porosus TaxID=8502 RepID=UPI00093FCBF2|nr:PREDICTED: zinc finger protein 704-like [Crocodylus porosus]
MPFTTFQQEDVKSDISQKLPDQHFLLLAMKEEDITTADTKKTNRVHEHEKENTRSVCLLEQKRKVVSSNIDVPPARNIFRTKRLNVLLLKNTLKTTKNCNFQKLQPSIFPHHVSVYTDIRE